MVFSLIFSLFKSGVSQAVSQQISISKYREFLTNLLLQTLLLLLQHLHLQLEFFSQLEPWFSWRAFMCCCCCCCCVFFSLWGGDLSIWRLHRWHRQSPEYIPRSSITDTTRIPSRTHIWKTLQEEARWWPIAHQCRYKSLLFHPAWWQKFLDQNSLDKIFPKETTKQNKERRFVKKKL